MKNLNFRYAYAKNFVCFGEEGIEFNFSSLGNIILIRGENKDVQEEEEKIASNGVGKCFGKNTPILMYDGTIKMVQDVRIGDLVMGNDGTPRRVLTCAQGKEELYRVIPKKGNDYIVNKSHILTLKNSDKKCRHFQNHFSKSNKDTYNISVANYLEQSNVFKNLMKGYRAKVDFPYQSVSLDPYFLGIWLGDGSSNASAVTSQSSEVIDYIYEFAKDNDLKVRVTKTKLCPTYHISCKDKKYFGLFKNQILAYKLYKQNYSIDEIAEYLYNNFPYLFPSKPGFSTVDKWIRKVRNKINNSTVDISSLNLEFINSDQSSGCNKNPILNTLRDYNLIGNKHIPQEYKINNRETRLQLLAGLLDTDGYLGNGCFDFVNKNEMLANDVVFLARSLGFGAYIKSCKKKSQNGTEGIYWRVCISGNCSQIPTKIKYKKAKPRRQEKDVLRVGITVEPIGIGEYYGFSVDGNHLFLLGDFTVVHNSSCPEIIVYALFGKTIKFPKKVSHTDVVNNTKKKALVEVWWDKYRVVRTRTSSNVGTLRLWEAPTSDLDWKAELEKLGEEEFDKKYEKTKGGMPATQAEIERIIGLKYETFVNIFVFTDNNSGVFLECDGPAKREFVENLLYLEKYKEFGERVKKLRGDLRDKVKLYGNSYELLLAEKESVTQRLAQVQKQEKEWMDNKKKELNALLEQIKAKRKELENTDIGKALAIYDKAQEDIQQLESNNLDIDSKLNKISLMIEDTNGKYDTCRSDKIKTQAEISKIDIEIESCNADISKNEKIIYSLNNHKEGMKCLHCYGLIKKENYEHVINESNKVIKDCKDKIELLNTKKTTFDLNKLKTEEMKLKSMLDQASSKKNELVSILNKNKKTINSLMNIKKPESNSYESLIEGQIDNLKAQAISKKEEIDASTPYAKILVTTQKEIEEKEQECINKRAELKATEDELPYYEFWFKAFGDDGIRKFIIEGIIPALNSRVNHWLQFLIDSKIKLTFDNQLEEKIERVPSDGDPFVYHAMSGGERRRLNLAVSQAFAYIMTLNSGISPSLVFLDEVTTNIDPIGVVGIYSMIMELSKEKQVFVTTHDHDLLQMLSGCETINLVKENGVTKVLENLS